MGSSAASGKAIKLTWKTSNGSNQVIAEVDGDPELKYASNDKDGDETKELLKVIASDKDKSGN